MALKAPLSPFQRAVIKLYPSSQETGSIRTLPELIEFSADANPDHIFCLQAKRNPDSQWPSLVPVSNLQLKQAISRCAGWLRSHITLELPTVGHDGLVRKGRPVALFMESDLGLWIYEMALMGLGVPVLMLSTRLSATAVRSLLEHTSASAIIASQRLESTALEASHSLPVVMPLLFETFLSPESGVVDQNLICDPHHYLDESDRDVLILHSSGTTGLPKPIYVSHRHLLSYVNCHRLENESDAQGVNVSTLPLYHGFGVLAPALALGIGKTVCFPPASTVPNARSTLELLQASSATSLMTVPSILEDLTLMGDRGIQPLAQLDFVAFGGEMLKPAIGDRLKRHGVRLLNHYGTTESGPLAPIFIPDDSYNWRYFRLRDDLHFQLHEIAPVGTERRFRLTTFPFGWGRPFEIQDQLVCNPDFPESDFDAVGRNDDTIVLATGEKVQPQILEGLPGQCESVKTAIVFGEHQFEIGVLVQPATELAPAAYDAFKEQIWPIVLEAQEKMDEHARIQSMEAILIVPSAVTLARTDKGSIARKEVYKMFEVEIAQVYHKLESAGPDLTALIAACDLFERGMNSLQAIRVQRALVVAVTKSLQGACSPDLITRDFVYAYPSVRLMADFFRHAAAGLANGDSPGVDYFVQKYALPKQHPREKSGAVVLLTGATGSLGSHTLGSLALSPDVDRVICLVRPDNRSISPRSRLERSLEAKKLQPSPEQWDTVDVIECNMATSKLGLPPISYTTIQDTVTHILHMSWPMDFHRHLTSFQSQFQTLHNLLTLARDIHSARPHLKPRLTFISSIAVVGQYAKVHGGRIVPELPIDSIHCLNPFGYAQAKLVCERMLEAARESSADEMEVSYIRLGQISGSSETGYWNAAEHFPSLTLSWIPVNQAAQSITELLLTPTPPELVYHIENPVRQSWHDLLTLLASELDIQQALPMDDWLKRISETADEPNPAKKLYGFFARDFLRMACGEVIMGTDNARRVSVTLRGLDAVGGDVVRLYVGYWREREMETLT
ncbi:hypothetical protein BJX61DRAFT_548427 [Aspergillus egyptiacus]|nr:hypothetical protein BJX61DRAFT_548427 [Aspergillus egyptiacus]